MPKVRNTKTGQTLEIPADQVPYMSSQWQVVSAPVQSTPIQPAPVQQPTQQPFLKFYRIGGDIFEAGTNRKIGPTEWNNTWSGRAMEVGAPTASTAPTQPTPQPQVSPQKTFYRVGVDIYDASTNQKIGTTDWKNNWTGRATEVAAPSGSVAGGTGGTSGTAGTQVGTQTEVGGTQITGQAIVSGKVDYSSVPKELTDSPEWKNLDDNSKNAVAVYWKGQTALTEADKADTAKAFEDAKAIADPYFKGILSLAQDELTRTVATTKADFESKSASLQRNIESINQDLTFNRDQLSLNEQADLAALKRNYEMQLEDTRTTMSEQGLTFSSPRAVAEQRLGSQVQEAATSYRTKYGASRRNLEMEAARQLANAQAGLSDLTRQNTETITSATRATEAKVGTAGLPAGSETLGTSAAPIIGDIEAQRQAQILNLENVLKQRGSQPLPL